MSTPRAEHLSLENPIPPSVPRKRETRLSATPSGESLDPHCRGDDEIKGDYSAAFRAIGLFGCVVQFA